MIFHDVIDTKYVFGREADRYRGWTVQAVLTADDNDPHTDGDWATAEDISAWEDGRWQYVTVWSVIALDGVEIVREAISAVQHGQGPEVGDKPPYAAAWEADAFDLGNALGDVTLEAVREVAKWLQGSVGVEPSQSTFAVVLEWAEVIAATLQGQADAS